MLQAASCPCRQATCLVELGVSTRRARPKTGINGGPLFLLNMRRGHAPYLTTPLVCDLQCPFRNMWLFITSSRVCSHSLLLFLFLGRNNRALQFLHGQSPPAPVGMVVTRPSITNKFYRMHYQMHVHCSNDPPAKPVRSRYKACLAQPRQNGYSWRSSSPSASPVPHALTALPLAHSFVPRLFTSLLFF